jgi:hypothetical protein
MDTPTIPAPQDEGEKQVLDKLVAVRDQLLLRKLDRTTYVRSQDVMVLYEQTIEQVRVLNEIRQGKKGAQENRGNWSLSYNASSFSLHGWLTRHTPVDRVVDSCFQLLSLFFMTIGRNNEAPAAYALTSTIKRLLDHLTEANLFSAKDLESMTHTLERLSGIVGHAPADESGPYLETLISNRIERCRVSLENLKKRLEDYAQPILATHEKLVSLLRQMAVVNTKSKVIMPSLILYSHYC